MFIEHTNPQNVQLNATAAAAQPDKVFCMRKFIFIPKALRQCVGASNRSINKISSFYVLSFVYSDIYKSRVMCVVNSYYVKRLLHTNTH